MKDKYKYVLHTLYKGDIIYVGGKEFVVWRKNSKTKAFLRTRDMKYGIHVELSTLKATGIFNRTKRRKLNLLEIMEGYSRNTGIKKKREKSNISYRQNKRSCNIIKS